MTPDVDNVLAVFRIATPEKYKEGKEWYPQAYRLARRLSSDVETAAGVIAALSPRKKWEENIVLAKRAMTQGYLDGGHFPDNVSKVNRILTGEHPTNVLGQGKGKKTLNFYHNIINPYGNEVTVDTWAFRIAVGLDRAPTDKEMKTLERKGVYETFADVYRDAATIFNLPVPAMQAITWVVKRESK